MDNLLITSYDTWSVAAFSAFSILALLYWWAEFKTKSNDSTFSMGTWIKENIGNFIGSAGLFVLLNYSSKQISFASIAAVALIPNLLIDWIASYRANKLGK